MLFLGFSNYQFIFYMVIALVFSICAHEYAHAYVAKKNGDLTAAMNGRLTMNPFRHFDLFGFLMMLMLGFGYAKPVPVNPNNFRKMRLGVFTTAIAGITVNFILMILSIFFEGLFFYLHGIVSVNFLSVLFLQFGYFFYVMSFLNAGLFIFNLLPVYPLDGFRVIESFTKINNPVRRFMRNYSIVIWFIIIVWGSVVRFIPVLRDNYPWLDFFGYGIGFVREWLRWPFVTLFDLIFKVGII